MGKFRCFAAILVGKKKKDKVRIKLILVTTFICLQNLMVDCIVCFCRHRMNFLNTRMVLGPCRLRLNTQ